MRVQTNPSTVFRSHVPWPTVNPNTNQTIELTFDTVTPAQLISNYIH